MLAQAQQCFFEKAASDKLKPGVVARLAAQVAAFYASASTGLSAYASLKWRAQADKTWAHLLEWNEKAFGAWAQVHAAAEIYLPYTSPISPLHLPYISPVWAQVHAAAEHAEAFEYGAQARAGCAAGWG